MQSAPIKHSMSPSEMQTLHKEIERLQMNVMEMQDMAYLGGQDKVDNKCKEIVGDPEKPDSRNIIGELQQLLDADISISAKGLSKFQQRFGPYFKESIIKMCSTEPIELDELPGSILDRYSNKTRDQFLVTVYPSGNLWVDAEIINRFVGDLERVSDKATGVPPLTHALIRIFARDGRNAVLLTLVIVFLLLCIFQYRKGNFSYITDHNVRFRFPGLFCFPRMGFLWCSTIHRSGCLFFDQCNYSARNSRYNREKK